MCLVTGLRKRECDSQIAWEFVFLPGLAEFEGGVFA